MIIYIYMMISLGIRLFLLYFEQIDLYIDTLILKCKTYVKHIHIFIILNYNKNKYDVYKGVYMIKAISKLETMSWFLGFGLVFAVFFYGVIPVFEFLGLPDFYAYLIALTIPFILMLCVTGYLIKKEGVVFNFKSIAKRLNYKKIERKDVLLLVVIFAIELVVFIVFAQLNQILVDHVY